MFKHGACGLCIMAEVRQAELQAEIARHRPGRQETALLPSLGDLAVAGWRRLRERFEARKAANGRTTPIGANQAVGAAWQTAD